MESSQFTDADTLDLARFDDAYASAPDEGEEVPDGKYTVNVDKVEITKAQSSGNTMLKWTFGILGPDHQGRLLWKNNVLVSEENLRWLKADLAKCGLVLEKLSDLPANLSRLLDVHLLVTKKTSGEFSNVYINRRVEGSEPAGARF